MDTGKLPPLRYTENVLRVLWLLHRLHERGNTDFHRTRDLANMLHVTPRVAAQTANRIQHRTGWVSSQRPLPDWITTTWRLNPSVGVAEAVAEILTERSERVREVVPIIIWRTFEE